MSDIAPDVPVDAPVDAEFAALIDRLRPFFLESAKAAVTEAVAAVPVPVLKPATVQGVDSTVRTATVLIDGDTVAITAQVLTELPGQTDRVMVEFVPPSAVFVVGLISAAGVPAGSIQAYAGPVTAHAGAASSSATTGQPPRGWLWCAGQAVSRSTYSALYNAIGTTYGVGDGATTFNVPDFRGRIPLGLDNMGGSDAGRLSMSNTLGGTGGAETHTLSSGNLGSHTHTMGNHTHSTPNHSHAAGSYAVSSHTHSISSDGSHSHTYTIQNGGGGATGGVDIGFALSATTTASTSSDGSHSHGGSTGSASPGLSGSSASDGSGTSGAPSTNTTDATGSGTAVNHLQPYILIHWLVKT